MSSKHRSARGAASRGFTIIEIMFVLAIGGLILLLVFQALPALQRNSRNNQRKQDVAALLAIISHYELNNSGNLPPTCDGGTTPKCNGVLGLAKIDQNLTFYTGDDIGIYPVTAQTAYNIDDSDYPSPASKNWLQIHNYDRCQSPGNSSIAVTQGAGYNDVAAIFHIENGDGTYTLQCEQL